jgi:phosphate starvation-inducible PhoH-like protein
MAKKSRKTKQTFHPSEKIPQTRKKLVIKPRNAKQRDYIDSINTHDITFGIGSAGTGKSYLAALLAVQSITECTMEKIVLCRPAVMAGGEDIGFLPGDINAKMDPYLAPVFDAMKTYWSPQTIKQHLIDGVIEIVPLAFMRGRSFNKSFILCDEFQNSTPDNMLMLLTRLGEDSKIVITGDPAQSDINGFSSFHVAERNLLNISDVNFVKFKNGDVVRHPVVEKILNNWPNNGQTMPGGDQSLPSFITNEQQAA